MANTYFKFKQFVVHQDRCAMKVTTDSCLFGAWVAEALCQQTSSVNILDIGAGTGVLSLMIAQKNNANINSIEIDKESFIQASENITLSPWAHRFQLFHGDIREQSFPIKYNMIVCNPPFYEHELKSEKAHKNIAHHSEQLTLRDLLMAIKRHLSPGGSFYLLLPFKRNDEVRKLLLENDMPVTQIVLVRQSVKHDYFRIMLSGVLSPGGNHEIVIDEMAIWNENQEYTSRFSSLLKDYYLLL